MASIPNVNYYQLVMPLLLYGRFELQDQGILDRTHLRWFTKQSAIELMSPPGLEVDTVFPNIFASRFFSRLNRLTAGRLTRFGALQYVIRARRVQDFA